MRFLLQLLADSRDSGGKVTGKRQCIMKERPCFRRLKPDVAQGIPHIPTPFSSRDLREELRRRFTSVRRQ
jgi:hypothetical protein